MTSRIKAGTADFIDDRRIEETLAAARPDAVRVREVLAKSFSKKRLEMREMAALLAIKDPGLWQEVFAAARRLKTDVYGNRIVLFAPLYVGDKCINNCAYCGFKCSNRDIVRKTLSDDEFGPSWPRWRIRGTSVSFLSGASIRITRPRRWRASSVSPTRPRSAKARFGA